MTHAVDIDCRLAYDVLAPTEFLFQIQAAHHPWQTIQQERLTITGIDQPDMFTDLSGLNRIFRFSAQPCELEVRYQAVVDVHMPPRDDAAREIPIAELPPEALHFLLPSRYCQSDTLGRMAQRTFGQVPMGATRVQAICDWVHENIAYEIGSSHPWTTAADVLTQRAGVCRDFAHVPIALCRALNIPARFVFGHVEFDDPPPDFHALFEVYLQTERGPEWMLFDATKMAPVDKLVRIGTGEDARDVAFATLYGSVQMRHLLPMARDHLTGREPDIDPGDQYIGSSKPITIHQQNAVADGGH